MSVLDLSLVLALRIGVILVLYAFLLALILAALRDLSVEREPTAASHRLIVLDPGQTELVAGQVLPLWTVTALGRDRDNAVVLDDEFVSAVHASAYRRDGQWWLRDEGSTNGTFLNGQPVLGEAHLQPGDELQIGSVLLQVVL